MGKKSMYPLEYLTVQTIEVDNVALRVLLYEQKDHVGSTETRRK